MEKSRQTSGYAITFLHSFPLTFFGASFADLDTVCEHVCCGTRKVFRRTFCRLHNLIKHKLNCGPFPWKLIQTSGWTKETEKFTQTDCYLVASKKLTKRYATSWHCEGTFEQTSLILTKRRLFLLCTQLFSLRGRFLVEYTFQSLFTHNDDETTSATIRLREVSIFHQEFSSRITTSFPVRWLLLGVRVGKHFCHPPSLDYEQHNTQIKYRFCCKSRKLSRTPLLLQSIYLPWCRALSIWSENNSLAESWYRCLLLPSITEINFYN